MDVLLLFFALLCIGQSSDVVAARNEDPEGLVGAAPYEMAGRTPAHAVLVDFEDLTGWTAVGVNGAHAEAFRSREQRMFGEYVAKVVYAGDNGEAYVELRPPAPIAIPQPFTGVNLWVYGNNWWWYRPPETVCTRVSVVFRDSHGQEWESELGVVNAHYWHLFHSTVIGPREQLVQALGAAEEIAFPCEFVAIRVRDCTDPTPQKLFFDALQFYMIEYPPLEFPTPPKDDLWSTDPGATAPPGPEPPLRPRLDKNGVVTFPLNHVLSARYAPKTGTLADLTYEAVTGERLVPCADGGVVFAIDGESHRAADADAPPELVGRTAGDGWYAYTWRAAFAGTEAAWTIRLRRENGSLVVEVDCAGGIVREVDLGHAQGVAGARAIEVPYWCYSTSVDASVLYADVAGGLFLSGWFDWRVANGSEVVPPTVRPVGEDGCRYLPAVRYRPKTDGARNDLHERILLCASPRFEDVLPDLGRVPADAGEAGRLNTWRNIGFMQPDALMEYKRRGIDRFTACHHEVIWRDGGESFTLRLESAPVNVGDERLKEYSELVRGLGYNFGLYTNYTDYAPVNQHWDEDAVALDPDGRWLTAWPRCYAPKPALAWEREAWFAPRIHEKFRTTASYCDVASAITPWARTDYDARAPGAGTYRAVWESYARCLHQETENHAGPAFSEGLHLWMYAGLCDGNYAQISGSAPWLRPPLVDFDLRRIHPLETDLGMGRPEHYFRGSGDWSVNNRRTSEACDRFLCATIAFGHVGYLANEWRMDGTLKTYFLIQPLQRYYALVPVVDIRYQSDEGLVDTSRALALGAVEEHRQVYARYASGLETWCNLSFDRDWTVRTPAGEFLLPPTGWAAVLGDEALAYSALIDGHRVECLRTPDVVYVDTRDATLRVGPIRTHGAVALKRESDGWTVIPATDADPIEIDFVALGVDMPSVPHAEGVAPDGTVVEIADGVNGRRVLRTAQGVHLSGMSDLAQCRLTFTEPQGPIVTLTPPDGQKTLVRGEAAHAGSLVENRSPEPWGGVISLRAEGLDWTETSVDLAQNPIEPAWFAGYGGPTLRPAESAVEGDVASVIAMPEGAPEAACALFLPVVDPVRLSVSLPSEAPVAPPAEIPLRVRAESRLAEDVTTELHWALGEETGVVHLSVPAGGAADVELTAGTGAEDAAIPITLQADVNGTPCAAECWLWSPLSEAPILDLLTLAPEFTERLRGQPERPLDAESGACFYASPETVGGTVRHGYYVHPPYYGGVGCAAATYDVTLPEFACGLRMHIGFRDGATTEDGCEFRVLVTGEDGEERLAASALYAEIRKWRPMEADLSAWAGQTVRLTIAVDVGPADDSTCDWAAIGEPVIRPLEPVALPRLAATARELPYAPPPHPLEGLKEADLATIEEAWLHFEAFGMRAGCEAVLNGVPAGALPDSASGDEWGPPREMTLSAEAARTIGASNELVIRNPNRDCFNIGRLYLRFRLTDGRVGSTRIVNGPFCSDGGWLYREGEDAVALGDDLLIGALELRLEG